jgi:fumarate reductase subunit C
MSGRVDLWLYVLQRVSAMILAPIVLIHLGTMVYAIRGGLTAAEILSRTQGSIFWTSFYGLFVVAVAVHASIGLRTILREMTRWRGRGLDVTVFTFMLVVLMLGFRAVGAVT